MKMRFKVAVMMQRTIPRADGSIDQLTLVKMTPQDAPAGDVLLGFHDAEVEWHPETFDESPGGDRNRRLIKKETLIRSVKVVQNGEPFTFVHEGEYVFDISVAAVLPALPVLPVPPAATPT